jgi:hypothetical protein
MDWAHAWVIGGGPSAADVDVSRFARRGIVVGVNDAAFYKSCDVFFSNDHNYVLHADVKPRLDAFPGHRHLSIRARNAHLFTGWPRTTVWRRVTEPWPTRRRLELSSGDANTPGCSGYVVLNLLAQMGARSIVLFGYDFHDDYRYFFDEKPHARKLIPGVRESFRKVAKWYRREGIAIWNANPHSAIDAFPKISHEAAYGLR